MNTEQNLSASFPLSNLSNLSNLSELSVTVGVTANRAVSCMAVSLAERAEGDRGQGVLEYAGVMMIVAAIVVAILKLDIDVTISNFVSGAVADVNNESQ